MDDDTLDLIVLLCTRVGIIMEDMSVIALTIRALDDEGRGAALAELRTAARNIELLVRAAEALDR